MLVRILGSIAVCLPMLTSLVTAQTVEDLIRYAPEDANSLVILRVEQMINSPRGLAQGWSQKHEEEYASGGSPIPPWVKLFVKSSFVRPGAFGGEWVSGAIPLPDEYSMEQLAKREGSEVQQINSHAVVYSAKKNGYFVEFKNAAGKRFLGGMAPSSRQQVSDWIVESAKVETQLTDYLVGIAAESEPQMILAVDFNEMLDPSQIRYRLSGSPVLADRSQDRVALTVDLQSLQGVRMAVMVGETTKSEIRFDFKRNVGSEGKYLKDLLVELLNDSGSALDELNEATVKIDGKSVFLNFPLSDDSLHRVLSLATATLPHAPVGTNLAQAASKTPTPPAPMTGPDQDASLRFYRAVNKNVSGMEKAYKRINNYRQTAQWHDNFAKHIDELPIENVDPELLDYGQTMSSMLRALGASLRGMGVKVDALNQQIIYNVEQKPIYYSGADWWWGGAHTAYGPYNYGRPMETIVDTNLQEVRAKQSEVVANSQPERDQIWNLINEERSVIRRSMVAKYGKRFEN